MPVCGRAPAVPLAIAGTVLVLCPVNGLLARGGSPSFSGVKLQLCKEVELYASGAGGSELFVEGFTSSLRAIRRRSHKSQLTSESDIGMVPVSATSANLDSIPQSVDSSSPYSPNYATAFWPSKEEFHHCGGVLIFAPEVWAPVSRCTSPLTSTDKTKSATILAYLWHASGAVITVAMTYVVVKAGNSAFEGHRF
ncbi:hypothetical protein B0H10DRAFT_1956247 [Mycena sp. CBHHK59/15]|nr:hypothetical protein B0H10DRAFT_1956247 [Mycena sp. CBHHK59/15]